MTTFEDRFSELVSKRGIMARLSAETELSTGLLSNYKNGKAVPSLSNALKIADALDVSLDYLAGREGFDERGRVGPAPALAPDEAALVGDYRKLKPRQKNLVREQASTMADDGDAKNMEHGGIAEAG